MESFGSKEESKARIQYVEIIIKMLISLNKNKHNLLREISCYLLVVSTVLCMYVCVRKRLQASFRLCRQFCMK